ncbi:MAG: quinol:cytochrome C oxidoreductase [Candidatus Omnitrophota bacterium]|nr:MAG: quinol:cytochrome C oxidoreductase [Candidatus Omnitrophota bacterium]
MSAIEPITLSEDQLQLHPLGRSLFRKAGIVGVVALAFTFVVSLFTADLRERFFFSYLLNFTYFLSLSLGALFFVALQHLTRSGWSVVVRRLAEFIAANVVLLAGLFVVVLLGLTHLYHWLDAEHVAQDSLLQHKQPYLNLPFFLIRCVFYFAVWSWLSRYYLTKSVELDESGDVNLTLRMERISAPGMILYALTVTFAAFDLLMSLDAHWFSTIFGVYYFTGGFVGFVSLLALLAILLQKSGRLRHAITAEHYHDLGKLMFAFIFFWGYIAFSQFMLIWYANIPEETGWFFQRQSGGWGWIGLILIFGHFILPFLGLLSRYVKRRKKPLAFWAVWILLMHWIDLYWLILPEYGQEWFFFHSVLDIGCFIGIGGLFLACACYLARDRALIPLKDPRLQESLTFENA